MMNCVNPKAGTARFAVAAVLAIFLSPSLAYASTIPCLGDCAGDEQVTAGQPGDQRG